MVAVCTLTRRVTISGWVWMQQPAQALCAQLLMEGTPVSYWAPCSRDKNSEPRPTAVTNNLSRAREQAT